MNNKIVDQLYKKAVAKGWGACKFNFRGVGQSTGKYEHGIGEQQDLINVVKRFTQEEIQGFYPRILVGYSFGAAVVSHVITKIKLPIQKAVLIAPPVNFMEVGFMDAFTGSLDVFAAENDELIAIEDTRRWFSQLRIQKNFHIIEEADHYFIGKTTQLIRQVMQTLEAEFN